MNTPQPSRSRSWSLFSAAILLLSAGWIWFSKAPPGSATGGEIQAPSQGFVAPDFTLQTAGGDVVTLSELRGRAVLINLWASWCRPCRSEMPALERLYAAYHDRGFEILAVNATDQDDQSAALAFARELGLTFPILLDPQGVVSRQYALRALPTSFFIQPDGVIQEVVVGGPMSEALLRVRVETLLPVRAGEAP